MNIISVFWVVRVEDELLTLWKKKTYTYIIIFIYTSFGFIWDIEIQPEKRAGKSLTIAFHQFSKETDSMSYVLWIWSICPCGAHLVTESFVVKSTSQLDIDLLSGSHVVWIDWSKGFRGFNSSVHWRFQGKKRWEQMTEGFHPNYKGKRWVFLSPIWWVDFYDCSCTLTISCTAFSTQGHGKHLPGCFDDGPWEWSEGQKVYVIGVCVCVRK